MVRYLTASVVMVWLLAAAVMAETQSQPLYGMVVVIDPGHGGTDPGSSGVFSREGIRVSEDEYVYDVSLRLERILRSKGAIVVKTIRDAKHSAPDARPANSVMPPDQNEVFTSNGRRVQAGGWGLLTRVRHANSVLQKYPRHRVVFLSIHFDSLGRKDREGVHFIRPRADNPELVGFLVDEFGKGGRLQNGGSSVLRNGDVRNILIMRGRDDPYSGEWNRVRQRVLVELGNFSNEDDVWRIRDYRVRESYAQLITRALIRLNSVPLSRCRE